MTAPGRYVDVLGVTIDALSLTELLQRIAHAVDTRQRLLITYANVHGILLARHDSTFRQALERFDLLFCDGYGPWLGARMLGQHIPERNTPPDWIDRLAPYRLFLLGARPGVADLAAGHLRDAHGATVVGAHHGYFDPHSVENGHVVSEIRAASPDIVLVGMGMPKQEHWALNHHAAHQAPVVICVGALFDYLAGTVRRGPRWLTDHGFEWLARLWYEPRRLGYRYLVGNPTFLLLLFHAWWRDRILSRFRAP